MAQAIDIILPLGRGSRMENLELRIALRSICQFATGWRRVVIIGEKPTFFGGPRAYHIPAREQWGNKEWRIAAKVVKAFDDSEVSDKSAFWNDDYVLIRPTDVRKIPPFQRGPLLAAAKNHSAGRYQRALETTHVELTNAGLPALHYDVHLPAVYDRRKFLGLAEWWRRCSMSQCGFVIKSVYHNATLKRPGPECEDLKLKRFKGSPELEERLKDRWLFSYTDTALESGLDAWLLKRFPEPCEFELSPLRV